MDDPSPSILASLVAQNDIRRLLALYADAVSRRDAGGVSDLFAVDASVRIAGGPERSGRNEIVEGLRRTIEGFRILHQKCDTGLIDVHGKTAHARVGVMEVNTPINSTMLNIIVGTYEDEYRLDRGQWYFWRRQFTMGMRSVVEPRELQEFPPLQPTRNFASKR